MHLAFSLRGASKGRPPEVQTDTADPACLCSLLDNAPQRRCYGRNCQIVAHKFRPPDRRCRYSSRPMRGGLFTGLGVCVCGDTVARTSMRPMVTWMVGSGFAADRVGFTLFPRRCGRSGRMDGRSLRSIQALLRTIPPRLHDTCGQLRDPIPDFCFLYFRLRCGNPPGGPLTPYRQFFPCLIRLPVRSRHRRRPGRDVRGFQLLHDRPGHILNPGLADGIASHGLLICCRRVLPGRVWSHPFFVFHWPD